MSEEIEKHVLRRYEVTQKLGKGVRARRRRRSQSRRVLPLPVVLETAHLASCAPRTP